VRAAAAVAVFLCVMAIALTFQFQAMLVVLLGGAIVFGCLLCWAVWDQRRAKGKEPAFVDELEVDENNLRYSAFAGRVEAITWSDVVRVEYYFGEPDFPDPLVGLAPSKEWRFYGSSGTLSVPELRDHSERLTVWCVRKFPGFRDTLLEEAMSSKEPKTWLLWKREGERPNRALQPTPASGRG